jgi:NADH-quinone oxidoreductase subunit C
VTAGDDRSHGQVGGASDAGRPDDEVPAPEGAVTPGPGPEGESPAREDRAIVTVPADGESYLPVTEVVGTRTGMFGIHGTGDTSGYGGLVRKIEMPRSSRPPYGGWFDAVAEGLGTALGATGIEWDEAIESVLVDRGEITFFIRRHRLLDVCRRLRDEADLRFEFCAGVSGAHYPDDIGRELHAVYHLLSITHNRRIRLVATCPDSDPHVPSVVSVYPTNDWHERETYDFFGIVFDGHPGLTRIQMPDDWPGHPQRKDYPLGGIPVEFKGATIPPPDQRRAYS